MKKRNNKKQNIIKTTWDKFWFLLWKDDSWRGWIFSIVFLFVFIKLILFPTLSFVTGTTLPLAIVESCSMYHGGNLLSNHNEWWKNHEEKYNDFDLTQEEFENFIFNKGFNKGDILFIIGVKPEKVKIGDVIIFEGGAKNPIIHRVINITEIDNRYYYSTIGDNNNGQISFEKNIAQEKLIGKAVFKLAPYLGWVKLIFFEGIRPASEKGFCKEN